MLENLLCPYTGLSIDERIDDVCKNNCTVQSECPLGYDNVAQDFDDNDGDNDGD